MAGEVSSLFPGKESRPPRTLVAFSYMYYTHTHIYIYILLLFPSHFSIYFYFCYSTPLSHNRIFLFQFIFSLYLYRFLCIFVNKIYIHIYIYLHSHTYMYIYIYNMSVYIYKETNAVGDVSWCSCTIVETFFHPFDISLCMRARDISPKGEKNVHINAYHIYLHTYNMYIMYIKSSEIYGIRYIFNGVGVTLECWRINVRRTLHERERICWGWRWWWW